MRGPEFGPADRRCPGCGTPVAAGQRFCQECGSRLPDEREEPGERRILTAIFCDMVGSTGMAERIGEEPMHEVLDRLFQIAGEEVSRFGGAINKHLGDGFLALVGTPVAHEDHALRAVLAALALQERIGREWPEGSDPRVRVRIGVGTGVVVVGQLGTGSDADLTAIGDTVNVASRLEALAAPGTVLIAGATEEAVHGYVAVEPAGSVSVRGREEPVEVFLATGRGERRSALDDPSRRVSPLVGRHRQMAALAELLEEAREGRGQVVGIVAEPGMGKSRLVAEFAGSLDGSARLREGRCLSYGSTIPFVPIADIVRAQAGIGPAAGSEEAAAALARRLDELGLDPAHDTPYLANLVGARDAAQTALRELSPEAVREATFDTLMRTFAAEAAEAPTVVVIEDLHWVDPVSQDVLARLVEQLPGQRILLLCTYRPGYQAPWMQVSYATQLALPPLGATSSRELVGAIVSDRPELERAVDAVVERADGNPFFIEELSYAVAGGVVDPGAVPATVHDVLLARIDQLDEEPRRLLRTASVLGREFGTPLLAEVWGGPPVEGLLEELRRREFVVQEPGAGEPVFAFRHALTQDVAYSGLLDRRRRELHEAAGEALERLHAGRTDEVADRLGHHFSSAGAHEKAAHYLAVSAERALRVYSNASAAEALEAALRHVEEAGDAGLGRRGVELAFRLAFTYYLLGRFRDALELLRAQTPPVEELGDPALAAEHDFWLSYFHTHLGNSEEAHRHAHRAIDVAATVGDPFTAGRAHYVLTREDFWLCRYSRGIDNGRRAVELLESSPEWWWWLGHATAWKGLCHLDRGEFEDALRDCRRMNAIGVERADPRLVSYSEWNLGWIEATRGNTAKGVEHCARSLERSPDPLNSAYSTGWLGFAHDRNGDHALAIAHLERSIASLRGFGYMRLVGWFGAWLADAYLGAGRVEEARRAAAESLEVSRSVAYPWAIAVGTRAMGRIAEADGHHAEAAALLDDALEQFTGIDARFDAAATRLDLAHLSEGVEAP